MTSKEALNKICEHLIAILEMDAPELIRIIQDRKRIIEQDLEILEIFKKYLLHIKPFFHNQEQWNREEFRFTIESDNLWLEGEDREQYRNDFLKIKEWHLKEVKK